MGQKPSFGTIIAKMTIIGIDPDLKKNFLSSFETSGENILVNTFFSLKNNLDVSGKNTHFDEKKIEKKILLF